MDKSEKSNLLEGQIAVLRENQKGSHTMPAPKLYPHQWLWDSCFIAIGMRHIDVAFAKAEIISLFDGQWSNGMIPNMIFDSGRAYRRDRDMWRSWLSPFAPAHVATSGITQPPMLAEAVKQIGELLPKAERKLFYRQVLPKLIKYHEWLYAERDPHNEGLVLQIHPYETGLDNTPPWLMQLREHSMPWWITVIEKTRLDSLINLVRRDTRHVPPGQRMNNIDALIYWDVVRRLRRKNYDISRILHRSLFCIEDITFNSILVRANTILQELATDSRIKLPTELLTNAKRAQIALSACWSEKDALFYSRDFITHELIDIPTVGSLIPLYSGAISKQKAEKLVQKLTNYKDFAANFPVPSVPLSSPYFNHEMYWQGPSWININWLIINGLRQYGYDSIADELTNKSLELVEKSGPYEYFSPIEGTGLGAARFSWTAALTIDFIKMKKQDDTTKN